MARDFVVKFGPDALRRLAAGTKRATVVKASHAERMAPGQTIIAVHDRGHGRAGTTAGTVPGVRIPLRVEQLRPLPNLDGLPAVARRLGLVLSDFTPSPDWPTYQKAVRVHGPAVVVTFTLAGPVQGELPPAKPGQQPERGRYDGPPGPANKRSSWHRVIPGLDIAPADLIHPSERDELRTRIAAAIRAHHPGRDTIRALAPVTDSLLKTGRAGPAALGGTHRERLGDQLEPALDWLTTHGLLTGTGPARHWSHDLLADLHLHRQAGR